MRQEIKTFKEFKDLIYELEGMLVTGELEPDECERLKLFVYDEYNRVIRRNNKNKTE